MLKSATHERDDRPVIDLGPLLREAKAEIQAYAQEREEYYSQHEEEANRCKCADCGRILEVTLHFEPGDFQNSEMDLLCLNCIKMVHIPIMARTSKEADLHVKQFIEQTRNKKIRLATNKTNKYELLHSTNII